MDNIHYIMEHVYTLAYKYYVWLPYAVLLILLMLIVWAVHEKGLWSKKIKLQKIKGKYFSIRGGDFTPAHC